MSKKFRMALAGLTVVAMAGGILAADPADAGKKRKHKKKAKVVKVYKGKSVKQVSKGGNAKAGNGGNGGSGGSSGMVNNTGNVGVGTPGTPGTPDSGPGAGISADCVLEVFDDVDGNDNGIADTTEFLVTVTGGGGCATTVAFRECVIDAAPDLTIPELNTCLVVIPGTPGTPAVPGGGGAVFSGTGGAGAPGGDGGTAIGGDAGSNTNVSTVTVTRDDHSIDVG